MLYTFFWVITRRLSLYADVSEHSVPSSYLYLPMRMEQSVPKRRHINSRRRVITQKKAYKIFIYLYSFLTSTLDGRGFVVNATPRPLYLQVRAQVNPMTGQQGSGKQKTSCPAEEFEPRTAKSAGIPTILSRPPDSNEHQHLTVLSTGVLISPQPDQERNKLQRQKILMFIYHIYHHNWRNISTIHTYIYIYIYITRLASNEIFSPSKYNGK